MFRERHHASIREFENVSSVKARTRRSTPVAIRSSTWAFTFSTPASARTTGAVSEGAAARLASSSTVTPLSGANVSVDSPRQDASREVVDHGMEIGAGPVEQADDGDVDVPHLVRASRAQPDRGFRRMHGEPGATPAVLPDEAVPGGGRGPHPVEPLGEDGERAGGGRVVAGGRVRERAFRQPRPH
jgi:hypothetical protein